MSTNPPSTCHKKEKNQFYIYRCFSFLNPKLNKTNTKSRMLIPKINKKKTPITLLVLHLYHQQTTKR
ncbi:hypothetical protein YC2023_086102 [Brassica napus]